MSLLPGMRLGTYEITAQIGLGGMGKVYRATDMIMGRQVAIKALADSQDSELHARFMREARAASSLRHRNILSILDVGSMEGLTYYVMPYVAGGSLADLLEKEKGGLPVRAALAISVAIASALEHAHQSGIIHRDVKPSNVLLPTSNFDDAVLTDFGLHGRLNVATGQTVMGEMFGTPVYMAPEQMRGEPQSAATDFYGLGILLYQMVYGRTPFNADSVPLLMQRAMTEPVSFPSMPAISPELQRFIRRCLEKTPNRRPTSPLADLRRLDALLKAEPTESLHPVSSPSAPTTIFSPERSSAGVARWRHFAMVGGGLAAIAIASTFVALQSSPKIRQGTAGFTLMLVGVFLGLGAQRWLHSRRIAVADDAAQILTGTRNRDVLTQSLAICVDQILARCQNLDEKILGRSLAIMVGEVQQAQGFDDRHRALTAAVDFLEKLMTRLTPWYVKYEKLIAIVVTLVGIIPGILTIAEALWRD